MLAQYHLYQLLQTTLVSLTIKEPKLVFASVMAEVGPLLFYLQCLTLCSVVAGQSGLVGVLASTFIDWSIQNGIATEDYVIAWVKGDTTDSINYLASEDADIAITYNAAAESRSLALNTSTITDAKTGFGSFIVSETSVVCSSWYR